MSRGTQCPSHAFPFWDHSSLCVPFLCLLLPMHSPIAYPATTKTRQMIGTVCGSGYWYIISVYLLQLVPCVSFVPFILCIKFILCVCDCCTELSWLSWYVGLMFLLSVAPIVILMVMSNLHIVPKRRNVCMVMWRMKLTWLNWRRWRRVVVKWWLSLTDVMWCRHSSCMPTGVEQYVVLSAFLTWHTW